MVPDILTRSRGGNLREIHDLPVAISGYLDSVLRVIRGRTYCGNLIAGRLDARAVVDLIGARGVGAWALEALQFPGGWRWGRRSATSAERAGAVGPPDWG